MDSICLPPGFRFHPTDEELIQHYLRPKLNGQALQFDIIREVDIYNYEPWDLPEKSLLRGSDTNWYFFGTLNKKYPRGARRNRSTKYGFWKITGNDKIVKSHSKKIGMKRTLVFHEGRAPRGKRTDWVMYEYRLEDDSSKKVPQDAVVLCHVSKKKRSSSIDNDEVPCTEGDTLVDELVDVPLIAERAPNTIVLDGISDFANADNQLDQRVQELSVVSKDANIMGSITTDPESQPTADCDPGMFPVEASGYTDVLNAHNDEELIKELHDSLLNRPAATEAIEDDASEVEILENLLQLTQKPIRQASGFEDILDAASLMETTDELLAEDPWHLGDNFLNGFEAGDAVDLQEDPFCLVEMSGETYSPISRSLQFAVEDSTQVKTTTQLQHPLDPRNLQSHEPLYLGSPLMDAASVYTYRTQDCDAGFAFQSQCREDMFPVEASGYTDVFAHTDEELIKELHDSLLNRPAATDAIEDDASKVEIIEGLLQLTQKERKASGFEDIPDASLIETTDEILAEDLWHLGDHFLSSFEAGDAVINLQGHLLLGETYSPVSQSLQFAVEESTQVETTTELYPRNLESEPFFMGSPLMDAAPIYTQRAFATSGSSSQSIISSEARPLSRFAKFLDAISVPRASAAEVPPNFKVSMPPTAPSRIHQAPSLRSVSVKSFVDLSLISVSKVRQYGSTKSEVDCEKAIHSASENDYRRATHSNNVGHGASNFMNSHRNQRSVNRNAPGSFAFIVLLGAVSAIIWFLLLLVVWKTVGGALHVIT